MKVTGFQDTIAWYNANATKYADATSASIEKNILKTFIAYLPPKANVLDAGCGSGRDTQALSDAGLQVIGLDISTGLLAEAKKRYPNCTFIEGNFLTLHFLNKTFDGIWAHASLLHLETREDVKKALSEFNRVLTDTGILHISVKAQTGAKKTEVTADSLSGHKRFFQYFTRDEVKKLLEESGFKILSQTFDKSRSRPDVQWIKVFAQKVK